MTRLSLPPTAKFATPSSVLIIPRSAGTAFREILLLPPTTYNFATTERQNDDSDVSERADPSFRVKYSLKPRSLSYLRRWKVSRAAGRDQRYGLRKKDVNYIRKFLRYSRSGEAAASEINQFLGFPTES